MAFFAVHAPRSVTSTHSAASSTEAAAVTIVMSLRGTLPRI